MVGGTGAIFGGGDFLPFYVIPKYSNGDKRFFLNHSLWKKSYFLLGITLPWTPKFLMGIVWQIRVFDLKREHCLNTVRALTQPKFVNDIQMRNGYSGVTKR